MAGTCRIYGFRFHLSRKREKEYQLKAEYYDNRDYAIAKLQWKVPQIGKATRLDLYGEAGKAVRECETVVAVLGLNKSIEREGQDRYDIRSFRRIRESFCRKFIK